MNNPIDRLKRVNEPVSRWRDDFKRIIRDEPALITAAVVAAIDLVAALGFDVPGETIGLVTAVLAVLQGMVTRSRVTPTGKVVLHV